MYVERQTFLNGNDLPSAAHVKTLMVPTGSQGIPAKLEQEGKSAASICTDYPTYHLYNTRCLTK